MKNTTQFIVACLLVCAGTPTRIESSTEGTVALVDVMESEVVFAADSRVTTEIGSYEDNDCKLMTFENDAIFVASGSRRKRITKGGQFRFWDSHTVAREAISMGRHNLGKDTLASLAINYWADIATAFFQAALDAKPGSFESGREIISGAFASRDDAGKFSVYTVGIMPVGDRITKTIYSKKAPQGAFFGDPVILQEFTGGGQSVRSEKAVKDWEKSQPLIIAKIEHDERFDVQLIKWAIEFSGNAKVGGDANVVILDEKGIRWKEQKDYCK